MKRRVSFRFECGKKNESTCVKCPVVKVSVIRFDFGIDSSLVKHVTISCVCIVPPMALLDTQYIRRY